MTATDPQSQFGWVALAGERKSAEHEQMRRQIEWQEAERERVRAIFNPAEDPARAAARSAAWKAAAELQERRLALLRRVSDELAGLDRELPLAAWDADRDKFVEAFTRSQALRALAASLERSIERYRQQSVPIAPVNAAPYERV